MATLMAPIEQAHADLDQLVDEAAAGDEVISTRGDAPDARLVAVAHGPKRQFGRWRGLIHTAEAFDAPLELAEPAR